MTKGLQPEERRGGRNKGTPIKRTAKREAKVEGTAAKVSELLPGAFEGDAHALLMMIYKDRNQPLPVRMGAAKAAIGFEIPKLSSVKPKPAEIDLSKLTDKELEDLDRLLNKAAVNSPGTGEWKTPTTH